MMFEDIGFRYLGPVDGHNIEELERMIVGQTIRRTYINTCKTKKEKDTNIAEENPDKFHATSSFDIKTGNAKRKKRRLFQSIWRKIVKLARKTIKI